MQIYIDVSVLTLATFVTGIQRVTREIAVRLIQIGGENIILLHYNAKENTYYRIDNKKFCDYYTKKKGIKSRMITSRRVPLGDIGEDAVFFDLDAAWMGRVKRSYLLPILKGQGARIVAHVYDIISITHPQYCLERGVYNFMDFIGAHLQYADDIIVNAEGVGSSTEMAKLIELATGIETRATILGHIQRGGNPTCKDRVYASALGTKAVELLCEGKTNRVVGYKSGEFVDFDIQEALAMTKDLDPYLFHITHRLTTK